MNKFSSIYEEVHNLLEGKGKNESETEPYKSKYAARELLAGMKSFFSDRLDSIDDETVAFKWKAQLAAVLLQLGIIGIDTEELSTGQEHLEKALELLSSHEVSSSTVCTIVLCHNHLAVLWSHRDDQKKAQEHLNSARDIYTKFHDKEQNESPLAVHELFGCHLPSVSEGWDALENIHTLTLYYLAQVMGQLGHPSEAAHLCLTTLHRQLTSGEYQSVSWAINAATLAKFYHANGKFRVSRRLLAAGWTMLNYASDTSNTDGEKLLEMKADVCRRFGNYCLELLKESVDSLMEETEDESHVDVTSDNPSEEDCLEKTEFTKLELTSVESSVSCIRVKSYEEARDLFMTGLRWLNDAQKYFCLQDHASTYTSIVQDISSLYKLLTSFEESADRKSKMHKRRIDMLTSVLKELNPQYYLLICRQLDYEIAEAYSAMIDCKYALMDTDSSDQRAAKINSLVSKSIEHFKNYVNTFKVDGKLPEKFPAESVRPILIAYFHMARLWSKKIVGDVIDNLDNVRNSRENYQFIVDYCDANPECCQFVSEELPLCKEMSELMLIKMEQLRSQTY